MRKSVKPSSVAVLAGLVVTLGVLPAHSQTFTYDALGRVTQIVQDHATATHSYDNSDNRSAFTAVVGANTAPVANDDNITTHVGVAVTFNPLINDTDANNDPCVLVSANTPSHGTETTNPTSITYTPAAGYSGTDSFSYTMSDGHGGTATATIHITIS